jgi:hypothetical protein
MAKTSAFGFSNTTAATVDITPIALGLTSNYSVTADTANEARLNNKTAPIDVEELVWYKTRSIPKVDSDLNIQYPSPVKGGVQYFVTVEDTLSTTDSADATFRVDEPIVAQLSIRHPKSGNVTAALVGQVVTRLLSACRRNDGSWRFDDLMRSAERPVVD